MKTGTTIVLLACILAVGCDGAEEFEVQSEAPPALQMELKKNKDGADVLVLSTEALPRLGEESEGYKVYFCWVDAPAPPGGYPLAKRIELRGGDPGGGETVMTVGLNAHLFEQGSIYYGRGRVCAIAVSDDESFISNLVRVPDNPEAGSKNTGESEQELEIKQTDQGSCEPAIKLGEALKTAEDHIKKEGIDVSDHYIDSIRLIKNEKTGTRRWSVTWLPNESGLGGEIWMSISMDRDLLPTIEFGR